MFFLLARGDRTREGGMSSKANGRGGRGDGGGGDGGRDKKKKKKKKKGDKAEKCKKCEMLLPIMYQMKDVLARLRSQCDQYQVSI